MAISSASSRCLVLDKRLWTSEQWAVLPLMLVSVVTIG